MKNDLPTKLPLQVEKDIKSWCDKNYDATESGYSTWLAPAAYGYSLAAKELEEKQGRIEQLEDGLRDMAFCNEINELSVFKMIEKAKQLLNL